MFSCRYGFLLNDWVDGRTSEEVRVGVRLGFGLRGILVVGLEISVNLFF